MNERIKELAEQARIKDHWSIDEARYLTNYLDEKKFAELIVAECVSIAQSADDDSWKLDGKGTEIARNIQQHFGVEE